jgi:hypothetical protein
MGVMVMCRRNDNPMGPATLSVSGRSKQESGDAEKHSSLNRHGSGSCSESESGNRQQPVEHGSFVINQAL